MKLTPIVAAALVAGALAAPASQASRRPLHCGATITKSTKLTQDLTNCPGVGLRIGADAITLDLNGHTVAAAAKRNPTAHGILNVGHDRVTIKGGTVKGFGAYGVRLAGVQRNHVVDMKMTANFTGIGLVESSQNLVERSAMIGLALRRRQPHRRHRQPRHAQPRSPAASATACCCRPRWPTTAATTASSRTRSTGNGIQVNPGQVAAMIARNTIHATAGDGIVVYEPSTILQGNAAAVSAPNGAVDRGA